MDSSGLSAVRSRIAAACARSGRPTSGVTLVAVSKGRTGEEVLRIHGQGHRHFGENRAEELDVKAPQLPDDIVWHMVGTVQSRKAATAARHASLIHSVDRESLARRLGAVEDPPDVLVQVNVAAEPQKHGVASAETGPLIERATELGLRVTGLMLIPPAPVRPEDSRRWFAMLRALRDEVAMSHPEVVELSMGMTDDFEVAVEEGATIVRVGRAIFDVDPGRGPQ